MYSLCFSIVKLCTKEAIELYIQLCYIYPAHRMIDYVFLNLYSERWRFLTCVTNVPSINYKRILFDTVKYCSLQERIGLEIIKNKNDRRHQSTTQKALHQQRISRCISYLLLRSQIYSVYSWVSLRLVLLRGVPTLLKDLYTFHTDTTQTSLVLSVKGCKINT